MAKRILINGTIVSDANQIEKIKDNLRGFGGNGKLGDDKSVYRQVFGKVVPLGVGFTLNPAADVQGVATPPEEAIKIELKTNKSSDEIELKEEEKALIGEESVLASKNNISQEESLDVKKERIYMKITKIEDITDSLLKEVTASSIVDFVAEELKKANETFLAEKSAQENELKAANEKIATVTAEHDAVKKQVEVYEEFDLSDEDRKVLASDLKDLTEDAFSAYKGKMAVLMKEKNKAAKKVKMDKEMKNHSDAEEAKASEEVAQPVAQEISTTQEVVEQAVDNGSKASIEIPNSAPASQPSVKEKYAAAFGLDGFELTK